MEIIKACPLCGGPGRLKDSQGRQVRQGWVGCPACSLFINWKISPDGAVRKWNRRAAEGGCPYYIRNVHDRGDDSLCSRFGTEAAP